MEKNPNTWSSYHAVSVCYQQANLIHEGMTDFPLLKSLSCFDHCLICTHYPIQLFFCLFFFPTSIGTQKFIDICPVFKSSFKLIIQAIIHNCTLSFFRIRFFFFFPMLSKMLNLCFICYMKQQNFLHQSIFCHSSLVIKIEDLYFSF